MTLDQAIEHSLEVSRTSDCPGCREDHRQLAEWLQDYRRLLNSTKEA